MTFKGPGQWRSQAEHAQARHQVIEFGRPQGMAGRITLSHGHLSGSTEQLQDLAGGAAAQAPSLAAAFERLAHHNDGRTWGCP